MLSPPHEDSPSSARGGERGIVIPCYSRAGAHHVEATVRSIRRHEPDVPVAVLAGAGIDLSPGIDPAIIIRATFGDPQPALAWPLRSPFDKTLCVAAGAVACRRFARVFDHLDRFELILSVKHGARARPSTAASAGPSRSASLGEEYLPQVDTSVFAFRRSAGIDRLMSRWEALRQNGEVDDDAGLAQILAEHDSVSCLLLDPAFAFHPERPSIVDGPVTFVVSELPEEKAVACGALLNEDPDGIRAVLGTNLVVVRDRLIEIVADLTRISEMPSAGIGAPASDAASGAQHRPASDEVAAPTGRRVDQPEPRHAPATGGPVVMVMGMLGTGIPEIAASLAVFDIPVLGSTPVVPPGDAGNGRSLDSNGLEQFNEELLGRLGGSRISPPDLGPLWEGEGIPGDAAAEAASLLAKLAQGDAPAIWPDPRNCLLLPFWRRIIDRSIAVIVTYRHPSDVAQLLNASGIHPAISIALWSVYSFSALRAVAGLPVLFVRFEDALADPARWFTTASEFLHELGIPIPTTFPLDQLRLAVDARRTGNEGGDGPPHQPESMLPLQAELFRILEDARGTHYPWIPPELPEPDAWVRGMLNWS